MPTSPAADPTALLDIAPDAARTINARVPFVSGGVEAAAPFRFAGDAAAREAATTCLAAAALYEAGDDSQGEQAVAQVVLNRLRHPSFPKSVCGVVAQGVERGRSCQFTFVCDGAIERRPQPLAWARARAVASDALDGAVYRPVGLATHYHTDWVVPYWASSLDKIAQVRTHIFYRWRGSWGRPQAFAAILRPAAEQMDARFAGLADPVAPAPAQVTMASDLTGSLGEENASPPAVTNLGSATLIRSDPQSGIYLLQLLPGAFSGDYATIALKLCRGRDKCRVLGYLRDEQILKASPLAKMAASDASFFYDGAGRRAYFNCGEIRRSNPDDCIPGTADRLVALVR